MPTYEYLCSSCGHEWEHEQSIKEEPQKVCQKCNQETARRQISRGVGFILKGGGWYADLYSSSSNKEPPKEPSKTNESKSETSSDTKDTKSSGGETKTSKDASTSSTTSTSSTSSTPAAAAS